MSNAQLISDNQDLNTNITNYKDYPLLRYMGSKYKLLDWIYEELNKLEFNSVLDGFSGSGAVSYLFKTMGKKVYTNDFLNMSYTFSKATIENSSEILTEDDIKLLLNDSKNIPNFIQQTYINIFYTEEELIFLDQISYNINKLCNDYKKALAKTALIRSCLKKQPRGVFTISGNLDKYNDGRRDLRLSIKEHFLEQVEIYNKIIFDNNNNNLSFHGDIYNFNTKLYKPDLVYLDPPYVPKSDDNCYIKRYHFIEGLSKYWEGEEIDYNTKVNKIKKKYTPFSYRKTAIEAFNELFNKFKESTIVLSYSSNGFPDLDVLIEILSKYKSEVEIKSKDHKYHFGNHKTVKRSKVQEYLIIGK